MYLLDTPVVLELRKARRGDADAGLIAWAAGVDRQSLFLSALTLVELDNVASRRTRKDKNGGRALRRWIDEQVTRAFDGRILAIDAAVARRRVELGYADPRDGLLAATAVEHRLTLVTGDAAAFKTGRIKLFNPWAYDPDMDDEEADWRQAAKTGPLWLKNLFIRT